MRNILARDSGFLLADADFANPRWAIDEVVEDLGEHGVAFLKHYGGYYKYLGYAVECKLAGFAVSLIAIMIFAGLAENVLRLQDPLYLKPGENEVLEALVQAYEEASPAAR